MILPPPHPNPPKGGEGVTLTLINDDPKKNVPVVLTKDEVRRIISFMSGQWQLMAKLLYGSGLRLMECIRLRVHDLDFDMKELTVRDGKGQKDRITLLPDLAVPALKEHLVRVKALHEQDLAAGHAGVYLPHALERKYVNAACEWGWQYVFPADALSVDPRSGTRRRHHVHESSLQKAVRQAVKRSGIVKKAGCHTFRHYAELGITATVLLPICSWTGPTSDRSRISWGTRTFPPP